MRSTDEHDTELPIWSAFGDLMAALFGVFVLFFTWMVMMEVSLTQDLRAERAEREATTARLSQLERALAGPLASGLITLQGGRIGIRGAVLFDSSSAELSPEGQQLLRDLASPLRTYLDGRGDALMISGFTDDRALRGNGDYFDNWELSAERALTVTRALVDEGIPGDWVFAAGFGHQHPVAPNDTEDNRALNRRVEIAPVPRAVLRELATPEEASERDLFEAVEAQWHQSADEVADELLGG